MAFDQGHIGRVGVDVEPQPVLLGRPDLEHGNPLPFQVSLQPRCPEGFEPGLVRGGPETFECSLQGVQVGQEGLIRRDDDIVGPILQHGAPVKGDPSAAAPVVSPAGGWVGVVRAI